jgi:hypothetical protein
MRLKELAPRLQAPPTKIGPRGKAWKIDDTAWRAKHPQQPYAQICGWIIEADWAHPAWHSYYLSAVHLRDMPGLPKAVIHLAGATHEVMLYALNPAHTPRLDAVPRCLTPGNFHAQWVAESDEAAAAKVEACVDDIIAGKLSPDTDYISTWAARFSASNLKVDPVLAGATLVGASQDGDVTIVGTGKTAFDALTTIAAGPVPPKAEQH